MKVSRHYILFFTLLLPLLLLTSAANAALIDNGDGTITDTDINIMWLQDVNYAYTSGYDTRDFGRMDWDDAMTWANNLVYEDYDDWRLPATLVPDSSCQDVVWAGGYNCTGSELGHMFYIELGNTISSPLNVGPFQYIDPDFYASIQFWSNTSHSSGAWKVNFSVGGGQGRDPKTPTLHFAWAVRDMLPEEIDDDGDGYSENDGDCDDTDPEVNPGMTEVPYNGKDDDCNAATPDSTLPDTGQTKCYQGVSPYAEIPCAGTGQDGEYVINPMSYTDNGNETVTDNNTGLMWQQGENPTTYNWYQASGTYDATYNSSSQDVCGELTTGGYSDWRLPKKKELMSIVDYSIPSPGPTIKTAYFPNIHAFSYWSSTPQFFFPGWVWGADFEAGGIGSYSKDGEYYVRCVRGEQLVFGNFVDNDDGTITDNSTTLIWQKEEPGDMTWSTALNYCENLELPSGSGQTDWRLPNIRELESITDDNKYEPAIDTTFFQNAYASIYWSSTTYEGYLNDVWYVSFQGGYLGHTLKGYSYHVRCVRGGYSGSLWTWESGSKFVNQNGIYEDANPANNVPGARAALISWTDSGNDLWLFGGLGYDSNGTNSYLNDLWQFDGSIWTWESGSKFVNQNGVYEDANPANNVPGARYSSISWIDSSDNLWLFGGNGSSGNLNDLWKYDGTNWTWESGSKFVNQNGVYEDANPANNVPGARYSSISWIDSSDNLWLFGGYGYDGSGGLGYLNDLWRYDGSNWSWISGSSLKEQSGVYGTKGIADPANVPGARSFAVSWIDSNDNLWLFGGISSGMQNDLWKFDGTNWTWVSGSNVGGESGVYGIKGIADPANVPGARENAIVWIDSWDNLWLFGGNGYDEFGSNHGLNDLWKFDGTNWTWVSGSNVVDQAGVYEDANPANNVPGARNNAVSLLDSSDNLWLFGGYDYTQGGYINDLWKYGHDDVDGDGYTENQGDCDDTDPEVNPGMTEVPYNGKDDDCNAVTLDDDLDEDGYPLATDCDDTDPAVNPSMTEVPYNGKDDDCDALTLDDDLDEDGYPLANDCDDTDPAVNPSMTEVPYNGKDDDCNAATLDDDLDEDGYPLATDCDDTDLTVNPGMTEVPYNGKDDDCDALTLDDDLDEDGYPLANDCDDTDPEVNPSMTEVPYNGKDDDCDALTLDDDLDEDGYPLANDCDDTDPAVNPSMTEVPYNGKDDDCNAVTLDDDLDEDGYPLANDCDDTDPAVNPSMTEVPYNGKDDDCNAATLDDDLDEDGYPLATDCDDTDLTVNPSMTEVPYNGKDDDCNAATLDDDLDEDGYPLATDCDDTDPAVNPGITEIKHDSIDQDCNGYDLTIDIILADYNVNNNTLKVHATSNLEENADLELSGFSLMTWFGNKSKWMITLIDAGEIPAIVTVCGIEGCESAPLDGCELLAGVVGSSTDYFETIQIAYDAAVAGNIVQIQEGTHIEDIYINENKSIILENGYGCVYTSITGETTIDGDVYITDGEALISSGKLIIGH